MRDISRQPLSAGQASNPAVHESAHALELGQSTEERLQNNSAPRPVVTCAFPFARWPYPVSNGAPRPSAGAGHSHHSNLHNQLHHVLVFMRVMHCTSVRARACAAVHWAPRYLEQVRGHRSRHHAFNNPQANTTTSLSTIKEVNSSSVLFCGALDSGHAERARAPTELSSPP